jgi:hypothetical protein
MQKHLYKSLSFLAIAVFILYWIANIQLSVFGKHRSFPGLASLDHAIAYRWRFFSPIPHSGNRVYFFVRDQNTKVGDSIELIELLLTAKRKDAPFNQSDNIIEHLLFHAVGAIEENVATYNAKIREEMPGKTDSFYYQYVTAKALTDPVCIGQLTALRKYAQVMYGHGRLNTAHLEYKIVLKEKYVVPFDHRNDSAYTPLVITRFETPYQSFGQ